MSLLNTKGRRPTPRWWLQLQGLLGALVGMGVTWALTDVPKTTPSHMPFWPPLAVWTALGVLAYVTALSECTPDKSALKSDWYQT